MVYQSLIAFGAAFLGSAVESVEALTIVLAVGLTRGWRYPLYASAAAVGTLVLLVLAFGQLVTRIPDFAFKIGIGTLLILFGMRWLHKAVLRSAGVIALHDEDEEYRETVHELALARNSKHDWVGFTTAYNGVFLEGLEVVFIVIAVGGTGALLLPAAAGGVAAVLVVVAAGAAVRHPLSKVPENTIKYGVGLILTSLGTFWAAEGMGVAWPLDIVSIAGVGAIIYLGSRLSVAAIRARRRPEVEVAA